MPPDPLAALLQRGDPDRWRSAMAAPPAKRAGLMALYAFNLEIARAPWATSEPMLAEIRLRWWGEAIEEICAGQPPRRHEIVLPLAIAIRDSALPQPLFLAMIEARLFDTRSDPHPDRAGFEAYVAATAGNLMELAARHLGAAGAALAPVREAGYAAGVAALLCAVPALIARGRDPIPADRPLDRAALARGETPAALAAAIRAIAGDAHARLRAARALRARIPAAALPALLPVAGAGRILHRASTRPEAVLGAGLAESEFRIRAARAWIALTRRW